MGDLRHALRGLRQQPAFAAVAVLTLAVGIGVNASVFGLLSAFFLRPLAIPNPQQLVVVMPRDFKRVKAAEAKAKWESQLAS